MTLILCFVGRHGALAIFMSMWFFFVSAMRYLCSFFLFSRNLSCSRSVHDRIGLIYARRLGSVLSFQFRQKWQNVASISIAHSQSPFILVRSML